MSQPTHRRSVFFELRGILGFVLLAILASHRAVVSPKLWLLGIVFLLSNFVILFVPAPNFKNPAVGYAVFFLDMTVLTVFFCAVSGIQSESLLLYYLTVFMATLGGDLRKSVGIAVVAGALYMGFHLSQGMSVLWNPEALMHIPLFFVTAISTGYLAQEVSTHRRRTRDLKAIQQTLESDLEVSSEDLIRSKSQHAAAEDLARRFHDLVQGLDAIIWEAEASTLLFIFVNQRAQEILGYPSVQWVTVPNFWVDHLHPEDRERTATSFRAILLAGQDHEFEYRMMASDGRVVWFRNIVRVIRDASGRALRVRGVMLDVTKQKLAEERDLLFTLSLDMMCIAGFDGFFKRLNPAWEKTLGYTREELMAMPYIEFVHPHDREATLAEAKKLCAGTAAVSFENRYRSKDGSYKWFGWTAASLIERQVIYGVARDNTDRKRAEDEIKKLNDELEDRVAERTAQLANAYRVLQSEVAERKQAVEALRESESHYRLLFESNPQPMWVYDLETLSFLAVNTAAVRGYGYSREDFLSMTIQDLRPPEEIPAPMEFLSGTPKGIDRDNTGRHRKKNGTVIDVEIISHSLIFGGRRAELVLANDITERKRAEESRNQLAAIVTSSSDAILSTTLEGVIVSCNAGAERMYGNSCGELVGRPISRLAPSDRIDEGPTILDRLKKGEGIDRYETVLVRKDGEQIDVEMTISSIKNSAGSIVGASWVAREITERKKLEDQFRQSQKMEAVGQLAGGVAHDFNNLLTIISGYSQLLLEQPGLDGSIQGHAKEILTAAERAAALTRQLLAFSRRQVLAPQVLELDAVVANVDKMLRRLIGENIELVTHSERDLGRVKADLGQIEQVIVNLAVNSRDAMPEGGKLTLETSNADLHESYTRRHFPAIPGRYVMLAVSDTGTGMTAETRAHMFEPFFTTKGQGKGTGLGLATVYGIVKQSNGYIWVYSEPGHGTAFKIYLPRVDETMEKSELPETASVVHQASETILVVEDEEAVRSLVRGILASNGYIVLEASGGDEALSICERHKAPIHLMLTDVIMPQMSGRDLAAHLAIPHPESKVLFMSGYTSEGIVHHGVLERDTAFLQKPFTPNSLVRKVREVLDSSSNAKSSAA